MLKSSDKGEWIAQQEKTFTRWVNDHIKTCDISPVENLATDLEDGVRITYLVCTLYGRALPHGFVREPKNIHQKNENITGSFELMKNEGIRLPFTKVENLTEHNLKMILGLIWTLILHYNSKRIQELTGEKPDLTQSVTSQTSSLKEKLRAWTNDSVNNDGLQVSGFTDEWRDGMVFLGIIHKHRPELVPDYESRTKDNAEDNLETAFTAGEKIGAPRLLAVEDMAHGEKVDENSVVTYVAELHNAIMEEKNKKEGKKSTEQSKDESGQSKKEEEEKKKEVKEDEDGQMYSIILLAIIITSGLVPFLLALPSYLLLADKLIPDKFPYLRQNLQKAQRQMACYGVLAFNLAVALLSGGGSGDAGDAGETVQE